MKLEQSAAGRTEVGPVQTITVGPVQTIVLTKLVSIAGERTIASNLVIRSFDSRPASVDLLAS